MNRIIILLVTAACMVSCANSYNVQGSSSVSSLDGSKLYLRTNKGDGVKTIDSCDVLHGRFMFSGVLDTVRIANLFMGDESILPIVLERGDISITIGNASQVVSGTPLNDRLYEFLDRHKQLDNQLSELSHRQSQMMLDGIDEHVINEKLAGEEARIMKEEDRLVTAFIVDNFDNVLGPWGFMAITCGFKYPVLTPQIEDIMSKATEKFKRDPYVKDYYQTASENEAKMQGLDPEQSAAGRQTDSAGPAAVPAGSVLQE